MKKQKGISILLVLLLVGISVFSALQTVRMIPADPKDPLDPINPVSMNGNSSRALQMEETKQEEEQSEEESSQEESSKEEEESKESSKEETRKEDSKSEESKEEDSEGVKEESTISEDGNKPGNEVDPSKDGESKGDNPGDQPDDDPGNKDPDSDIDPKEPHIVTDLGKYKLVTESELPSGLLKFYAYGDGGENLTVKINVKQVNQKGNGTWLTPVDLQNWNYQLTLGQKYRFSLYLYQKNQLYGEPVTYYVSYEAKRADADHPERGDHPPTITTNLDDKPNPYIVRNEELVFRVTAKTNPDKKLIQSNQIIVTMNGVTVKKDTGGGGGNSGEYNLFFEPPNRGDSKDYVIGVLAWDGNNSSYWEKTITYQMAADGDKVGTVRVIVDATTVLGTAGVKLQESLEIEKGETAAETLLRALAKHGYEAEYAGTPKNGFYLRRIARGDTFYAVSYNGITKNLWTLIERDHIEIWKNQRSDDSLGEYDYTRGSGWMYAVNGNYPGRALSAYTLQDGDVLALRFTLAYGKDIGGYDATGGTGELTSYCGTWLMGSYTAGNHKYEETDRKDPTGSEEGYVEYTCKKCKDTYKETIPATGETEESGEKPSQKPSESEEKPTKPSEKPTEPSEKPTEPVEKPTEPSTQEPEPPTEPPTEAPTEEEQPSAEE